MSKELLPIIVEVTYDNGTTTLLYLKVSSVEEESALLILKYIHETKGKSEKKRKMYRMEALMKGVDKGSHEG